MDTPLFDALVSREKKKDGLDRVATQAADWLTTARAVAVDICRQRGSVWSDLIMYEMEIIRASPPHHRNAYGAVTRGPGRIKTDRWRRSTATTRHAGLQWEWEWHGDRR